MWCKVKYEWVENVASNFDFGCVEVDYWLVVFLDLDLGLFELAVGSEDFLGCSFAGLAGSGFGSCSDLDLYCSGSDSSVLRSCSSLWVDYCLYLWVDYEKSAINSLSSLMPKVKITQRVSSMCSARKERETAPVVKANVLFLFLPLFNVNFHLVE